MKPETPFMDKFIKSIQPARPISDPHEMAGLVLEGFQSGKYQYYPRAAKDVGAMTIGACMQGAA